MTFKKIILFISQVSGNALDKDKVAKLRGLSRAETYEIVGPKRARVNLL